MTLTLLKSGFLVLSEFLANQEMMDVADALSSFWSILNCKNCGNCWALVSQPLLKLLT